MTSPDERPHAGDVFPGGSYSIHPLSALDGVMIYVTLNGEAVGSYFGADEEAAAAAVAEHLAVAATTSSEGNTR
jgi:hypothetical protein